MKKASLTILAALLAAGGVQAMGRDPGTPDTRVVTPGPFDRIAVAGPFRVTVRTDKAPGVSLSGPSTMLDDTELVVRDGQLIIRWQEGASWSRNGSQGVDIAISVPALREAVTAGSGSIEIDHVKGESFAASLISSGGITIDSVEVTQFRGQLAGSGSLAINEIAADTMEVDLAGSGAMWAKGHAKAATLRLAGASAFNNPDFIADYASILVGGSGGVRARVENSADVQSAGSGEVRLTGGAKCTVSKLGSGKVYCS